jgi:hypothetical protein
MKWAFEDENDFGILKQIRYKLFTIEFLSFFLTY